MPHAPSGLIPSDAEREGCERGLALLARGEIEAAVAHFDVLLDAHAGSRRVCEAASTALLAAAERSQLQPPAAGWSKLAQTLALQAACDASPPVLAQMLAAQRTERPHFPIARIATLLAEALHEVDGSLNKNGVLLLLVIRDQTLPGWLPEHVSALHLRWFKAFSFRDLALPYSVMFGGTFGPRNRDDLRRYVADDPDGFRRSDAVALTHLVFLEWLLGHAVFESRDAWTLAIVRRLALAPTDADSLAAAKSAALRHGLVASPQAALRAVAPALEALASIATETPTAPTADAASPSSHELARFESRRWQALQAARNIALARMPFLRLGRRRLKVAVCVSGQLRGYQAAFATWQQVFLRTVQPTLFVHSWTLLGRSGAHPARYVLPFEGDAFTKAYREVCHESNFDEFRGRYPTLFARLSASNTLSHETVAGFYGTDHVALDDESNERFAGMSNPQKMHYKISACHRLALASGQDFDLVVRLRPDKPIALLGFDWQALARRCQREFVLFADHPYGIHYGLLGIGDQFAIGAPAAMAAYADAWNSYPRLAAHELLNCPPAFQGHFSLGQVCWTRGLTVRKMPMRFGNLVDAAPLDAASITEALHLDAAGRMDAVDRQLIDAAASDRA